MYLTDKAENKFKILRGIPADIFDNSYPVFYDGGNFAMFNLIHRLNIAMLCETSQTDNDLTDLALCATHNWVCKAFGYRDHKILQADNTQEYIDLWITPFES